MSKYIHDTNDIGYGFQFGKRNGVWSLVISL